VFALGFLLLTGLGIFALNLVRRALPPGVLRAAFFPVVIGGLASYPFIYLVSPSFAEFQALCAAPDRYRVVKTKPVDFIYLEWGYASDCLSGPRLVAQHGYSGFDCVLRINNGKELHRYVKTDQWNAHCGIECFSESVQKKPEASYRSGHRQGYVDSGVVEVTYADATVSRYIEDKVIQPERPKKISFTDRVLVDDNDGIMGYGRDYLYYPYGNGWAKILGLASGSAPTRNCGMQFVRVEPTDVYPPKVK
jgi:hypothetical protein